MSVPASPFAGRLLAEIAKHAGGLPAAAAEMGVAPQVIDAIVRGDSVSPAELDAVHEWLSQRVMLMPEETEDYRRVRATVRRRTVGAIQPMPGEGQPGQGTAPSRSGRVATRTAGVVAVAAAAVVLIVVLTVVVTIVIIRPGNSGASAAKGSASPTAAPPSATSPAPVPDSASPADSSPAPAPGPSSGSPAAVSFPAPPPSPAAGRLIGSYDNFKLSSGYAIAFGPGGPPQPDPYNDNDLYNNDAGSFDTAGTGALALLSGAPTSYASCKADTALGSSLSSVAQGDTICFQGHGVVAAAYVVGYATSGGIDYVTLDVRVWQDPSTSSGP